MSRQRVYVISDLHLGGAPGFQMCPAQMRHRLCQLIREIAKDRSADVVHLVINGDFVDFLAEPDRVKDNVPVFSALRTEDDLAKRVFEQLLRNVDSSKDPDENVFSTLRDFVTAGNHLAVILGNHDVELTFPAVRRQLTQLLTNDAPSRIELVFDGQAYRLGPVIIEHGNRYDPWNIVHYGGLRAMVSQLSRGEKVRVPPMQPGSQLVVDVMNPLKQRYPFIDLLKPEMQAVIPILAALEPSAFSSIKTIRGFLKAFLRMLDIDVRAALGAGSDGRVSAVDDELPASLLECERLTDLEVEDTRAMLEAVALLPATAPGYVASATGWLGSTDSLWRLVRSGKVDQSRLRLVRRAFLRYRQAIANTYGIRSEEDPYRKAAARLARDSTSVVLFGHTHLPKSVELTSRSHYINTGTWCPTIQIDEKWYDPQVSDEDVLDEVKTFVEAASSGTIEALTPWLRYTPHYAVVDFSLGDKGQVASLRADLCMFSDSGEMLVDSRTIC